MLDSSSIAIKTRWERPSLIVLSRNHPEEAVLETCKCACVGALTGPIGMDNQCLDKDCNLFCSNSGAS
jgi:hypothetical protein